MNSNHSSKLLIAFTTLILFGGVVAGVSANVGSVPETKQVGSEVKVTVTLSDLYDTYDTWTLRASTELTSATWTVVELNAANRTIQRKSYPQTGDNGTVMSHPVDIADDTVRLKITVQGTVPEIDDYTFSPATSLTIARFERVKGGNRKPIETVTTRPYTEETQRARSAILSAQRAVNGTSSKAARQSLSNAIEFYDGEQFEQAYEAAQRAEQKAKQAKRQSQLIRLGVYAIIALIVIALAVGGIYWYRKNQSSSRL